MFLECLQSKKEHLVGPFSAKRSSLPFFLFGNCTQIVKRKSRKINARKCQAFVDDGKLNIKHKLNLNTTSLLIVALSRRIECRPCHGKITKRSSSINILDGYMCASEWVSVCGVWGIYSIQIRRNMLFKLRTQIQIKTTLIRIPMLELPACDPDLAPVVLQSSSHTQRNSAKLRCRSTKGAGYLHCVLWIERQMGFWKLVFVQFRKTFE